MNQKRLWTTSSNHMNLPVIHRVLQKAVRPTGHSLWLVHWQKAVTSGNEAAFIILHPNRKRSSGDFECGVPLRNKTGDEVVWKNRKTAITHAQCRSEKLFGLLRKQKQSVVVSALIICIHLCLFTKIIHIKVVFPPVECACASNFNKPLIFYFAQLSFYTLSNFHCFVFAAWATSTWVANNTPACLSRFIKAFSTACNGATRGASSFSLRFRNWVAAHHGSVETAASEGQTAVGAVGWEPAAWTCEGRKEERGGWMGG